MIDGVMWCFIRLPDTASSAGSVQLNEDGPDGKEESKTLDGAETTSESASSPALRCFWTPQSVYLDKLALNESELNSFISCILFLTVVSHAFQVLFPH